MKDLISLDVLQEIFHSPLIQQSAECKALEKSFTEQDKMLILLYFRWLTRKGARNLGLAHLERATEMTDATREWLRSKGMADVDDWEFMGMIDHGSTNEGITCSHGGHRLRYAYYAVSASTGMELVFGQSCGSEFFQVDLGLLKKLTTVLDTAKAELAQSFHFGRSHMTMAYSACYNMIHVIQRNSDFAALCYRYIGRTQIELWLNFINRGIVPPNTLRQLIEHGYNLALSDYLSTFDNGSLALQKSGAVRSAEQVPSGMQILNNPGIVTRGEFIYPLTGCGFFDAVRCCIAEELSAPSPLSAYYDMFELFNQVGVLQSECEKHRAEYPKQSRAITLNFYICEDSRANIHNALDTMFDACMRDDLRLVVLLFGLSPYVNNEFSLNAFDAIWRKQGATDLRLYLLSTHSKRRLLVLLFQRYFTDLMKRLSASISSPAVDDEDDGFEVDDSEDYDESEDDSEDSDDEDSDVQPTWNTSTSLADLLTKGTAVSDTDDDDDLFEYEDDEDEDGDEE